jgi:hypothetical protein
MFGYGGASAARSQIAPIRWFGKTYMAVVRGVPDIAFFLFFVIALDQGIEYVRQKALCPDWTEPVRQGNDFVVCPQAKMPLGNAAQWIHETYGFGLAVLTFSIVFGAFAANVMFGAMRAVPRGQLETAEAYGMTRRQVTRRVLVPQMWVYAEPLDGPNQGNPSAVPAGRRGHRLLGSRAWQHQDPQFHRLSAQRLAHVVLWRAAGFLSGPDQSVRGRAVPRHGSPDPRSGNSRR